MIVPASDLDKLDAIFANFSTEELNKLSDENGELSWTIDAPVYSSELDYAAFTANDKSVQPLADDRLSAIVETQPIITNLHKNPKPAIAQYGSTKALAWVHDDQDLDDGKSREIMLSIWDESVWSQPIQITDNLLVDFNPKLAFMDADRLMMVWQQASDENIPAGVQNSILRTCKHSGTGFSIYTLSSNT